MVEALNRRSRRISGVLAAVTAVAWVGVSEDAGAVTLPQGWYYTSPTTSLASGRTCAGSYGGAAQGKFATNVNVKLHLAVQHTADRAGTFSLWRFTEQPTPGRLLIKRVWEFTQPHNWITGTYTHDIEATPGTYAFAYRQPESSHGLNCHWWLTTDPAVHHIFNDIFLIP